MLGIISSRPCEAVNVEVRAPFRNDPCTGAWGSGLRNSYFNDFNGLSEDIFTALGGPLVHEPERAIVDDGVMGIDGRDLRTCKPHGLQRSYHHK